MKRVLLILLTLVMLPGPAFAISAKDRQASVYDTVFYDSSDILCSLDGPVTLLGSDNIEKAFRFYISKGMNAMQSAGITGNLMTESSLDPTVVSKAGYHGIAQWDGNPGGRWENLVKWARDNNKDELDLGTQLEYTWVEATTTRKVVDGIKQQPDIDHVAWYWGRFFEGAVINGSSSTEPLTNVQLLDRRIRDAKGIYNNYAETTNAVTTPPVATNTCAATGQNTLFVDGFEVMAQYDPAWKNAPYGSSTIGAAGCGPTAMAMIITALTSHRVSPVETSQYAASQAGIYVPGAGSSWQIAPKLAAHWGLQYAHIQPDVTAISTALRAGGLVIAAGEGADPFTPNGHYIVIRGVTADGKFKIADPGHSDTSAKDWDPQQIISQIIAPTDRTDSVYVITK